MPDIQSESKSPFQADAPIPPRDESSGTEALSHLAKMSGTGSTFGAADYVAINPTAVASLLLGFAGALSLLSGLFLFLPLLGILCGLLAIRQIRHSNGTQGGIAFAFAGILVSLLIGGVVSVREGRAWSETHAQMQACSAVISRLGEDVQAGRYDDAYDKLMTEDFRERISRAAFRSTFEALQRIPGYGPIQGIEWNHERMQIEAMGDSEIRITCLALIKCRDLKEPGRETFLLTNREGAWKISDTPLFPERAKKGKNFSE